MIIVLLLVLFVVPAISQDAIEVHPITLEELIIDVPAGKSREVGYTNKESGVLYTETNGAHRSGWQGWRIMSAEMMESYGVTLDGAPLRPMDAMRARVTPQQLLREYAGGIREIVTLLDSVDVLAVEIRHRPAARLHVRPYFADGRSAADFETRLSGGALQIAKRRHMERTATEDFPVWLTLLAADGECVAAADTAAERSNFSPGSLVAGSADSVTVLLFAWGDSPESSLGRARAVASDYPSRARARKARMERLLNDSYVRTTNVRFDKALQWAKLSMDALLMNQIRPGIFAGLPWFDNYWGRDTFIALPGATLVTGNFVAARKILRAFAAWQSLDSSQSSYGRIPNLVTTASIGYNTADGTPRFVMALDAYVRGSGDTAIIRELYPVVKRSVDGTIRYHADTLGFLTHGDAETWMDAVGPSGPWTPRGNRANDLQALWGNQLEVGIRWAEFAKDRASARRWKALRSSLVRHFKERFVDAAHGVVFDHLNVDGTPDRQFRPNQLATLDLLEEIGAKNLAAHVFDSVTRALVYPYGVGSLSQEDSDFHPYHHYPPFYVQDAAYHNGIVWTWLAGAWIDRALKYDLPDLASVVTDGMVGQILDRGAIGTLSELLDAAPRPGESHPRLSGTYSQAWSLAEFIRNFYEGYLGILVDAPRGALSLAPRLPRFFGEATFRIPFGKGSIVGSITSVPDGAIINLVPSSTVRVSLRMSRLEGTPVAGEVTLPPDTLSRLWNTGPQLMVAGEAGVKEIPTKVLPFAAPKGFRAPRLAKAAFRSDLAALRGPAHRVLSRAEVKRANAAASLLLDAADPEGDDVGTGTFRYPATPSLKEGSLDIRRCRIAADSARLYVTLTMRNLSDPGWHPEYGFQLTYAAIAIDQDGIRGSGKRAVGMNSQYELRAEDAFERVIYVGGGLRLDDTSSVLAEYLPLPGDEEEPLGSVAARTVSFSLPLELVGRPSPRWRFTILVGAQDDHGGAGLGEFRAVGVSAGEWAGGGKHDPAAPNVYDLILPR